jgi:hypothetical protein
MLVDGLIKLKGRRPRGSNEGSNSDTFLLHCNASNKNRIDNGQ